MEEREWECGLETEGYDVRCVHCGDDFVSGEAPKYCCNGRDCGCYGQPINDYECENCKDGDDNSSDN